MILHFELFPTGGKDMKKKGLAAGVVMGLAMLTGCSNTNQHKKHNNNHGQPSSSVVTTEDINGTSLSTNESGSDVTEITTEVVLPAGLKDGPDVKDIYVDTVDDIMSFLDGEWVMVNSGNPISETPALKIEFYEDKKKCTITGEDGQAFVKADISFQNAFEDDNNANLIGLKPESTSDGYVTDQEKFLNETSFYQILAATVDGQYIISLREIGNEDTMMSGEIFKFKNVSGDKAWIFKKDIPEEETVLLEEGNEALKVKGTGFYANRWLDLGDSVFLQRIDVNLFMDNWYGEDMEMLYPIYTDDPYNNYAIKYKIKDNEKSAHSPVFKTDIVYVETDENGDITKISKPEYLGFGYYNNILAVEGHKPAVNDEFLGEWVFDEDGESLLKISEDGTENGEYKIEFTFKDLYTVTGNANITDDNLVMNQGYINEDYWFVGIFSKVDDKLIFKVVESEYEGLNQGKEMNFKKK